MTHLGIFISSITTILLTHFHGDHCLGLPGVVPRLGLNRVEREVEVVFPSQGRPVYGSKIPVPEGKRRLD